MNRPAIVILAFVTLVALYLIAWPVPVDPVAWDAPEDLGLTGAFSENKLLTAASSIDLGTHEGPEDVALGRDGFLYATTHGGVVLKISPSGRTVDGFAKPGGRPLGIESLRDGSFLVANAFVGVQRISATGNVTDVVTEVNGQPIKFADDVAVADDGTIYFSEASTKFGAAQYSGTLEGSLLDILEHGGNGQIIEYDPGTGEARVIMDDLNFANGVAISDDQQYLLVAETGSYRILKYWLHGPNSGTTEVCIDNLPGFPDNINNGLNGRFWIGLAAPRNKFLDKYADRPFVRKLVQRLPAFVRPKPVPSSHVIAINGDGVVLMDLQDPGARHPLMTGVLETRNALYLTTLTGNRLPWLDKRNLR